jgi:acetyltransferase-like isoleucine patch superfamily enzyme
VLIKKNRIPIFHIATIGILPSFIKKFIYQLKGYKIGRNVTLNIGCVVIGKDVEIGNDSSVGFFTIIRAKKIKIGRYVKIGAFSAIDTELFSIDDDARINEQVYIGGMKTPESALIMGKRTIIMQASYINPTKPIVIGDDSGIGGHCLLFTHGSWSSVLDGYPVKFEPITIGKKVWLPWRVFVMPGVNIGDGVVVGADSLINKDIPANSLVAGSPAKILKSNFPDTLSSIESKKIIDDIFFEFIAYLKHHDYHVLQTQLETGFELKIINAKNKSFLKFEEAFSNSTIKEFSDSILILTKGSIPSITNFAMTISLTEKERIGSSKVGEELVSFLSRYGIRFNRLD